MTPHTPSPAHPPDEAAPSAAHAVASLAEPGLSPAVRAEVAADLNRLAHLRRRGLRLLALLVVAGVSAVAATRLARPFAHGLPWVHLAVGGETLLGMALLALAMGRALPSLRALRALALGAVTVGTASLGVFVDADAEAHGHGLACLTTGVGVAAAVALGTLLLAGPVLRRHGPTAILLGLGAGLVALAPLNLWCLNAAAGHVWLVHGLVPWCAVLAAGLLWSVTGGLRRARRA